jgi:hypothetical protein
MLGPQRCCRLDEHVRPGHVHRSGAFGDPGSYGWRVLFKVHWRYVSYKRHCNACGGGDRARTTCCLQRPSQLDQMVKSDRAVRHCAIERHEVLPYYCDADRGTVIPVEGGAGQIGIRDTWILPTQL